MEPEHRQRSAHGVGNGVRIQIWMAARRRVLAGKMGLEFSSACPILDSAMACSNSATASGDSGTMCALPFLVFDAGITHSALSISTSAHVAPTISPIRWPVVNAIRRASFTPAVIGALSRPVQNALDLGFR